MSTSIGLDGLHVVTVAECAEYLRVSKPTIYALGKNGKLRLIKVGRATRVPVADLLALIDPAPEANGAVRTAECTEPTPDNLRGGPTTRAFWGVPDDAA